MYFFRNRTDAGRQLAVRLKDGSKDAVVIALPRGGVPVAREVARALQVPLDVLMVKKLGAPGNPEYGIGAVTEEDFYWSDPEMTARLGIDDSTLKKNIREKTSQIRDWVIRFRGGRPLRDIRGKTILLIDDGLATGVSAVVAGQYLRQNGAKKIILAVPVGAPDSVRRLALHFDEIVCLQSPERFRSVGEWYHDFSEVSEREVLRSLEEESSESLARHTEIMIHTGEVDLPGDLHFPPRPVGLVLFAHGSSSSRRSPRNRQVAQILNHADIATFLFDLLTPEETEERANIFDILLLGRRLVSTTRYLRREPRFARLPLGYFGASTGGGAALWAAAELGEQVASVVSRGGRPDLAGQRLNQVVAQTLLIVGEKDPEILRINRDALKSLKLGELVVVPRATHLFEESGALEQVAKHSSWWFGQSFKQYAQKHAA